MSGENNILDKIYKFNTENFNKFLEYQMTNKEIEELEKIVYDMTSSMFPLGDFLNDIKWNATHNSRYNKQQALKDFCLIVYHINYWEKRSWALEIIKNKSRKNYNLALVNDSGRYEIYNKQFDYFLNDYKQNAGAFEIYEEDRFTKEEYDLLKGILQIK